MTRTLVLGALVLAVALAWWLGALDRLTLESVRSLLLDAGPLGPLLFVGLYVLAELLAVPAAIFVIAAGLTWPPAEALAIAWVGSLTAACVVFFVVRYLARDWAQARLPPRVRELDTRLGGRAGLWAVIAVRLVLFLAPWTHAALALSRVRAMDFVVGTAIGMTPGVALLVLFGRAVAPWLANGPLGLVLVLLVLGLLALNLRRRDA